MTGGGRLLVVVPHATRTGSTQVLLDLFGPAAVSPVPMAIDLRSGGARAEAVRALGPPLRAGERPAAVLANSALAAGSLLEHPDVPGAVYVHEAADSLAVLDRRALAGLRSAAVVACVSAGVERAVHGIGVDPERTTVVAPVVPSRPPPSADAVAAARTALGGIADTPLVVGCGEASRRKGTDLFLEVAARLVRDRDVTLAWVGRRLRGESRAFDADVARAGLGGRVAWVGDLDDARPALAAADVVVMASRHDPLPLVPLEAALVGTPTAALAIGGLAALGDAGALVASPFPDTAGLAIAAAGLLDDRARSAAIVEGARRWVAEHQAPEVVVPAFRAVLDRLLVAP